MSLPVVNQEIVWGILANHSEEDDKERFLILAEENPFLWDMAKTVLESPVYNESYREGYVCAALQFYWLLRTQDEVNELNG